MQWTGLGACAQQAKGTGCEKGKERTKREKRSDEHPKRCQLVVVAIRTHLRGDVSVHNRDAAQQHAVAVSETYGWVGEAPHGKKINKQNRNLGSRSEDRRIARSVAGCLCCCEIPVCLGSHFVLCTVRSAHNEFRDHNFCEAVFGKQAPPTRDRAKAW